MSLIILGEASTKLMDQYNTFVDAHPEVLWRDMRGMHNRTAHGYFDIHLAMVWKTVQTALPLLLQQIQFLLIDTDDSNSHHDDPGILPGS